MPGPTTCTCCGGARLAKLGEAITETLETIPRTWKVIQHVREKFTCRDCEKISQAPAPFHVISRGWAGPSFLAMLVFEKFGQHQPLNRQAERYAREGVPLSLSTLADQVGACCVVLDPIVDLLIVHVFAGSRIHGDDTTVPVLAKGKTDLARSWVYVRDDRPFGGTAPPAAVFYYSRDRRGEHPQAHLAKYSGILQADAFGGYNKLYEPDRTPRPITEAACWAHARRKFFELADLAKIAKRKAQGGKPAFASPMALEAVRRMDALFDIEREINGKSAAARLAVRQQLSASLVAELADWMTVARARLSPHDDAGKAMNYMLNRWPAFTRFLDDGRICLTNNAAELGGMTVTTIARLKITLDDVEPAVQRRVEVPLKIRLDRLHLVFQAAMGWTNSHLYEIRAGGVGWGMVDPDWGDGPMDASKSRLVDVLEDMGVKTLKYLYDFGDGWEHTVKIERIADALPGSSYPVLIDAPSKMPIRL